MSRNILIGLAGIIVFIALFILVEFLYIRHTGKPVAVPEIPREPRIYGSGEPLKYVVMGDSTSISQGGNYENGFAVASSKRLAENYQVTMTNTGISGATAKTMREQQLSKAVAEKPDVVLLAVGANDITKLTKLEAVKTDLQAVINELRSANPNVKIIVTLSPAVDAVTRFPIGAKQLVRWRVDKLNNYLEPFAKQNNLTVAPVAAKTRQAFLDDPSLLAQDKFHPNDRGYALWTPVINDAIDQAL